MRGDVPLHRAAAAAEANCLQSFHADRGITDAAAQEAVQNGGVSVQYLPLTLPNQAVRRFAKPVCFQPTQL